MAYDRTVKTVQLLATVRQATDQGKLGLLHVNIPESKSGMIVLYVLWIKHLDIQA